MEALIHSLTPAQMAAFLNGPALAPPPGVVPNFVDPPNNNPLCFAVSILSITLATVMVLVRLYSKIFCTKQLRWEDGMSPLYDGSTISDRLSNYDSCLREWY
jgi:hypothetical protein